MIFYEVIYNNKVCGYITEKYYNIILNKTVPEFYSLWSYNKIKSDKTFTELNSLIAEDNPLTIFHMSIIRLYKEKNYNPDIPWWEYNDKDLRKISDTFCNAIK